VARTQGREGWLREARHQLDEHRRWEAKPIVRSRAQRLLEAERRMVGDLEVERAANEAYEHYREHGRDTQGRRLSRPPKPYEPPDIPPGKINTTDLDSRNVKTPRSYTQGYNVQAVVTEEQIVLAAEVSASSPDFGHLEPMVKATKRELQAIGVTDIPAVAVADSATPPASTTRPPAGRPPLPTQPLPRPRTLRDTHDDEQLCEQSRRDDSMGTRLRTLSCPCAPRSGVREVAHLAHRVTP
jgi:hypothetical protein